MAYRDKENAPKCETCFGRCPDLLKENFDVWRLLQAGITQIRVAGMGGTIGFDYVALKILADSLFIDTSESLWRKVRAVEIVIRKIESQERKRDESRRHVRSARPSHRRR